MQSGAVEFFAGIWNPRSLPRFPRGNGLFQVLAHLRAVRENLYAKGSTRCVRKNFHGLHRALILFSGSSLGEEKVFLHALTVPGLVRVVRVCSRHWDHQKSLMYQGLVLVVLVVLV